MKTLARCFYFVAFTIIICNITHGQDWIPYVNNFPVTQTTITQQTFIPPPQPVVVYQYSPYIVQQPMVVEQRCLWHRTQRVIYVPQVQYFYQPIWIYR
jgi:hypothetical protein